MPLIPQTTAGKVALAGGAGLGVFLIARKVSARPSPQAFFGRVVDGRAIVTSGWGADRPSRDGTHRGIDLRAEVGRPVRAAGPGIVVRVDHTDNSLAGRHVNIRHDVPGIGPMISRYLHLDQAVDLRVGQRIAAGALVGLVGATGTTSGIPHLHFDLCVLSSTALAAWVRHFGTPDGGFPRRSVVSGCTPVPAEPVIVVDGYRDAVGSPRRPIVVPTRVV